MVMQQRHTSSQSKESEDGSMKERYIEPQMSVLFLEVTDIITTSFPEGETELPEYPLNKSKTWG